MFKRVRTSKFEKCSKEGRGSGIGANYKPWLNIQDVSSKGRSIRLKGTTLSSISLMDVQIDSELGEFIKVMQVVQIFQKYSQSILFKEA